MKQIITEVLEAEEAINTRLRKARAEADRIRAEAEKDIAEKTAEAQEEARLIIQQAVEQAKKEAEELRKEKLADADRQQEALMAGQADVIDQLVERICETILAAEQKSGSE